ncbi:MAG: tetratricopeptide repeat protein [Phycisphaerales bacterium]|nr:tetratricopeptide repeat protein [Phycisphaerales bacterium]
MIRLDDARVRLAEAVFRELVDLPDDERLAALQQRCGSDVELCALVERLLSCDARSPLKSNSDFLLQPAGAIRLPDTLPLRIGRYEILGEIDRGGVGIVYEARQSSPQRRVAVKVLQFPTPGPEVLRRFQTEAEALGRLNHPGIAQIYEAGVGDAVLPGDQRARLPFVAMEFVSGPSLGEFVSGERLAVPVAVELIARICDAVQHAHQKGIIHRDLKPGNILICRSDDATASTGPEPKVVDFGVARVATDLRNRTIEQTQSGQLLGTLAYMSPEQLHGDAGRIDTRSDVFSLGIIAYQLLVGRPPIDLSNKSMPQAIELLNRGEVPLISDERPELRGDLAAIVAKAVEREPERRYATAAEFAADLRRFLRHEPVTARPSGPWSQFRKFARRNRGLIAAVGMSVLLLLAGIVGTSTFAWREFNERRQKELEAQRAGRIVAFLSNMLSSVDPHGSHHAGVTVRDVLDAAAATLERGELADQPEARAEIHKTIGVTYANLEFLSEAQGQLRMALSLLQRHRAVSDADVIDTQRVLASVLADLGEFAEAESLYDQALRAARSVNGRRNPLVAFVLSDQAICYSRQGKFEDAERADREALELRSSVPGIPPEDRAQSLANLGALLIQRGQLAEAERFLGEAIDIRRALLPREAVKLGDALRNLGTLYFRQQRLNEAEPRLAEALQIHRDALDTGHPELARSLNAVAFLLKARDRNIEAIPLLREALDIQINRNSNTPDVGIARFNLAHALMDAGEFEEARREEQLGIEVLREKLGPRNPTFASALHNVGVGMSARGDSAGGAALLREALSIMEENFGTEHDASAHMRDSLGSVLFKLDCFDEARALFESALDVRRRVLGETHDKTNITWSHVALARMRTGDAAGAAAAARVVLPRLEIDADVTVPRASALLALAEAMLHEPNAGENAAAAEAMLAEALEQVLRNVGEASPMVADIHRVQQAWREHAGR